MDIHGQSKHMNELSTATTVEPQDDKALVIFMRPFGQAHRQMSTVFDVTNEEIKIIGILPNMKKIARYVDPGQYIFMVLGESTDYMSADLEAGKTYYARVAERMGAWKARFSLLPITRSELESEEGKKWVNETQFVEITDSAHAWFEKHKDSIANKHKVNYQKWMSKSADRRPKLIDEGS
ncbi:MAG: hypothetical protein ABFS39_16625 [Pseudomonadota bacterium]